MEAPMLQWTLAALAGVATVASPCVLPVLPMLLGASVGRTERLRPFYIVSGFVLAFVAVAWLFGAAAQAFGVSHAAVRTAAAALLVAAGVLMLWPAAADRLMLRLSPVAGLGERWASRGGGGAAGALLLGASLGAVWTPCAGPVLASILALVAQAGSPAETAPLLAAYALGAGFPMLLIAYGGQSVSTRWRGLAKHAAAVRRVFGALVIVAGIAMLGRWDAQATAWLTSLWSPASGEADVPATTGEAAPEFAGVDAWINSPPLTMAGLRGKVVLVDFWTFGCVNCVRSVPHIERLHRLYAGQGLVVVGVHTPEFGFERPLPAVQEAVRRQGLTYPVAQDNTYRTWSAYRNRYWPAQYLIDRDGRVVFRYFGEGGEREIEQRVRALLSDGKPG